MSFFRHPQIRTWSMNQIFSKDHVSQIMDLINQLDADFQTQVKQKNQIKISIVPEIPSSSKSLSVVTSLSSVASCINEVDPISLELISTVDMDQRITFQIDDQHQTCFDGSLLLEFWKSSSGYNRSGASKTARFFKIPTRDWGMLFIDEIDRQKVEKGFKGTISKKKKNQSPQYTRSWKMTYHRTEEMGKERFGVIGASHERERIYRLSSL